MSCNRPIRIIHTSNQEQATVQSGRNTRPIRNLHLFSDKACHLRLKSLLHDTIRVGGGNSVADGFGDARKSHTTTFLNSDQAVISAEVLTVSSLKRSLGL